MSRERISLRAPKTRQNLTICARRALAGSTRQRTMSTPAWRLELIMIARIFRWLETRIEFLPACSSRGCRRPTFWRFILLLHAAVLADDRRLLGAVGGHRPDRGVAVRLPRQSRRLAVEGRPRHLLVDARAVPRRHGRRRAARPAGAEVLLRGRGAPGPARQLRHAHALAGAPLRAAPVHGLLPQRLRRPRRHQGDADRRWRCARWS